MTMSMVVCMFVIVNMLSAVAMGMRHVESLSRITRNKEERGSIK
jgi:hypothetical protein